MIKDLIVIAILFISTLSFSQTTNSSPYSLFGIGDQANLKTVEEIAMGQMGGALNSEYQLSFTNPASYGSLNYTTYVFSGGNKTNFVDDGQSNQTSSAAALSYIALGIPIRGNQGLVMGLQLNTAVGYSLIDQAFDNEGNLTQIDSYFGNGGTNRVFLGYGYRFPFNLSLGAELAYVFGNIDKNVLNRRNNIQLATRNLTDSNVKGTSLKIGAHYETKISEDLSLKFGLAADLESTLKEKGTDQLYSVVNVEDGSGFPVDTLSSSQFSSTITSPLKTAISAGIGENNKWFVGAEYTFQNPLEFTGGIYEDIDFYRYDKFTNISVGGFYTPKINSLGNYFQRMTYRAGFNFQQTGLVVDETEINEYGISFGVSLPMGLKISNVNLGIELGKRGTTDNNLIEEQFFNFRLSLSLNDKWFRKQKIY
ncbi:hypothetical protein [Lutimonas vermicola]|uniref:Long-chain fatty acid transport protein n=1 Tax=Lutimonas vermicola TaxID=414288 RepID=A0ABU9L4I7_9FLAO